MNNVYYEFTALLLASAVMGAIAVRLRQPLIVTFIAVGILAAPAGLGLAPPPRAGTRNSKRTPDRSWCDPLQPLSAPRSAGRLPAGAVLRLCPVLVFLLGLSGCATPSSYEALLVLADAGAAERPSRLKRITPAPSRSAVTYSIARRDRSADLYLPGEGKPAAAIVLVPGAVPKGKDDPRLVAFAYTLARARFAVLTPELSGFRELKIRPDDVREVADAFAWLAGRPDLAPGGRAGMGAFSYAVGPALLAALENDVRERVRFIVAVGGYHDLTRSLAFMTTGYFEEEGQWRQLKPDDYGKLVFVTSVRDELREPRDRETLDAMVAAKLKDIDADLSLLVPRLGAEGRAVYDFATNADPARTPHLLAALPETIRRSIDSLTLAGKDLSRLQARLILVHGRNDSLIPYTESVALARSVAPGQARLFLIDRILGHVDLTLSHVFTWTFLTRELLDLWRMHRAVAALLREREADGESR